MPIAYLYIDLHHVFGQYVSQIHWYTHAIKYSQAKHIYMFIHKKNNILLTYFQTQFKTPHTFYSCTWNKVISQLWQANDSNCYEVLTHY